MSIAELFPVLIQNTSFVIPERKQQSILSYVTRVLCSNNALYDRAFACMRDVGFPPLLNPVHLRSPPPSDCLRKGQRQTDRQQGLRRAAREGAQVARGERLRVRLLESPSGPHRTSQRTERELARQRRGRGDGRAPCGHLFTADRREWRWRTTVSF